MEKSLAPETESSPPTTPSVVEENHPVEEWSSTRKGTATTPALTSKLNESKAENNPQE